MARAPPGRGASEAEISIQLGVRATPTLLVNVRVPWTRAARVTSWRRLRPEAARRVQNDRAAAEGATRMTGRWVLHLPCFLVALVGPSAAGQASKISLPPPTATLPVEFQSVSGVSELPDGRTLVVDRGAQTLVVADWSAGTARPIGRVGRGPGEYRWVSRLFGGSGGNSVVEDTQSRRWWSVTGSTLGRAINHATPVATENVGLLGVDSLGGYLEARPYRFNRIAGGGVVRAREWADSVAAVRVYPGNRRPDTVARLSRNYLPFVTIPVILQGGPSTYTFANPLRGEEQAILFPDGWVAIARQSPYRVEWRTAAGRHLSGPTLQTERVPVNEQLKRAVIAQELAGLKVPNEVRPRDLGVWPSHVPPFTDDALIAMADGRLMIRRTTLPGQSHVQYDLIRRDGRLGSVLQVRTATRVVAASRRFMYVATVDADGVETLSRVSLPR